MTVAQLLAEICSRCGEGYENYTERAQQCFESAIRTAIYSDQMNEADAPGVFRVGVYNPLTPAINIPIMTLLTGAGLTEGRIRGLRYSTDVPASMTAETVADDTNVIYSAITPGTSGNNIVIEYKDSPTNEKQPFHVEITKDGDDTIISVYLEVDPGGTILTTAKELVDLLPSTEAIFYITAALVEDSTGEGVVTALTKTPLAGGVGGGTMIEMERVTYSQYLAYLKMPEIFDSKDTVSFYFLNGTGTDAQIQLLLGATIGAGSNLEYSAIGWNETWLDTTSTVLTDLFSPRYLELLIQAAATALRGEILA